jgi:hypothetical protein
MLKAHRVLHASLRLQQGEQRELLLQALPLALQQALDGMGKPESLWLLRRLPCRLSLAADADLSEAVRALRQSLQTALLAADPQLADGDWVCLDDGLAALTEAFADALGGRRDRGWAWARLGLWPAAEAQPATLLEALLAALDRRPLLADAASPALADPPPESRRLSLMAALLARRLLPRLLALLSPAQWRQLAQGLPGAEALRTLMEAGGLAAAPVDPGDARLASWPSGAAAANCLAALHSAPLPATRRFDAALCCAWLALLHSEPASLAGLTPALQRHRLMALAARAQPQRAEAPARPAPPSLAALPSPEDDAASPISCWPSRHAGLLHLLPLLPALPPTADGRGLDFERLLALAVHALDLPLDEAVLAPWLGRLAPVRLHAPPAAAAAQAQQDRAALLPLLRAPLARHLPPAQRVPLLALDDDALLAWLIRREARLQALPGAWRVDFAEADTRLRRCGLDRDPGPLPWLGLSVSFRYE